MSTVRNRVKIDTAPTSPTRATNIPPAVLRVYLRLRYESVPIEWLFWRHVPVEYQLDSALMNYQWGTKDVSFVDAVGILVNGKVYVDDEPYWRDLLVHDETYDVVYLRRPFWQLSPLLCIWDACHKTPLIDAIDIPDRSLRYTTTEARSHLLELGLISASEKKPSPKVQHPYATYNTRTRDQIKKVQAEGRFIEYKRMRLFNESEFKEN